MKLNFLSGAVPLTKTIRKDNDKLVKEGYPSLKNFTSYEEEVETLGDFYKHLTTHAAKGHCLLKGILSQPLNNEPRKGMMPTQTHTQWACFDLDRAPFSTPDEFMTAIGCEDVSYVVQYSASYKLTPNDLTLSAHIFVLLDKSISPQQLKVWLMYLNLNTKILDGAISLSNSGTSLHWPLDITTCQNDKLLYITKPNLYGLKDPIDNRIQLVLKTVSELNISRIVIKPLDTMKEQAKKRLNALRGEAGFDPIKAKPRVVGEFHVQPGASAATTWEAFPEEDYIRYNLNGGDSRAYWHPKTNWEFLHSFKGEDSMLMKEILPEVYRTYNEQQRNALMSNANGEMLFAFREKRSAEYWKGTWDEETLELYKVKNETQLDHFMQAHGSNLGPFVPEWTIEFDPQNPVVVNIDDNVINTFIPTPLMKFSRPGPYPTVQKIIDHAVGRGEVQEHFMNWLAVIMQHRIKTQVAWVLHGTYGTGKGLILNSILKPIFKDYAEQIEAHSLNERFNAWRMGKLIIMVDEIEADLFEDKSVEAKLRNWISEPEAKIRRMNTDIYTIPCFNNWIFGSNKTIPVKIPFKDRRTNVGQYQNHRFITTRHEIEKVLPTEVEAFAHYLSTRKADIDMAGSIFDSEDRKNIMNLSINSIEELANAIISGNYDKLYEFMPDERVLNGISDNNAFMYMSLMKQWGQEPQSNITRDQLAVIFQYCIGAVPEGKNKFTRYLRYHGIETKKIRSNDGRSEFGITVDWIPSNLRKELPRTKLRSVK